MKWWSLDWFYLSTLKTFTWVNEWYFYSLAVIPLVFILKWLFYTRLQQKLDFAFPEKKYNRDWVAYLRFLPIIFFILSMTMIVMALARPQRTNESVEQWSEGIDIMLVLDISESMDLKDLKPNRLEAAKKVATQFIEGRFQDRIGIVIFSGEAYSLSPLTTDYQLLKSFIKDINFKRIEKPGTAIGSALAVAINRMKESDSKSKVIILISDGESNAGQIDPITAAELAYAHNLKIYTIAVGQDGKVLYGVDQFGREQYVENTLNETTLRKIAQIGEGKFFRATGNKTLAQIFKNIDKFEKAEIKETRYKDTIDYYQIYLTWGIIFFLIWLFLKSSFLSNALED